MSSFKCNENNAPDALQLNMENISKELNELIVTGEQEFGMPQKYPMATFNTTVDHSLMTIPVLPINFKASTYFANAYYGQQQFYGTNGLQDMKHNLNYSPLQPSVPLGCVNSTLNNFATNTTNYTPQNLCAGKYFSHSALRSTQAPYVSSDSSPTYEFHFLRNPEGNENKFPTSNFCKGQSQGAFRKMTKLTQKHFNQRIQSSAAENIEIMIDLSVLDYFNNDKENCVVSHLFDLLRDLHRAVDEQPPSFDSNTDSQFEETFVSPATKKSDMPSTLNVQNQVKQACRKLTIFTYDMLRLLNANKGLDSEMYAECEFCMTKLQQYLNQLETYKRIEMEHKQGKFLREEIKIHAERLSLLLEHTNRQIREVHIRILAFDWYMGVKYRGDVHVAATFAATMQLNNTSSNKEISISKKSKIGLINEILQLCNTPTTTDIKTNATVTDTKSQTATTKPEMIINSQANLINIDNSQSVMNVKPLLNKNNHIFNVYKPEQTRRAETLINKNNIAIATSCHTRHPVFYIG